MHQKTIGKIVTIVGACILLYAYNMSVSVEGSGVINFHMISERQNTLIVGCFVFLAGIILFSLAMSRQTETEAAQETLLQREKIHKGEATLGETFEIISNNAFSFGMALIGRAKLLRRLFIGNTEGWGVISVRLAVGGIMGYAISLYAVYFVRLLFGGLLDGTSIFYLMMDYGGDLFVVFMVLYALINKALLTVINNVFAISLGVFAVAFIVVVIIGQGEFYSPILYLCPFISVVGLIVIYMAGRGNLKTD